ncbi:MAG TPA: FtsW/RodA/SpoVE family cell cycle protein [Candidatus Paceibacterota bacterium]|jgi:rod shape determining protein RodA|nr:hypothetical protein [Parcubacteria group bacterium]MDP6249393.1 FtsW/RodA/SpoVE family cell cycle protein [Candidatus Paceibacterota bacterium]MDP7159109.1 FtsW/RodA/SpoVE family cell cycle protein [Candidatus Paceibacterota bacterium]MDP7648438.1 FtsW/RodA/SpoVE family cell cycle protein [Candidatus Paceibacterota bacterium]HJO89810.1 FtsW/RodA/SpoVE family cell cycle protein [Candidatus Paceibacterota bacterium]|tara:strand:- start:9064 stop:10212 length:1149 start_codon:yes stop_codon:yes gene_type:complete
MAPSNLLKGSINKISGSVDWILFSATLLLVSAGLVTMNSFVEPNPFFEKQIIWVIIGIALFFTLSFIDFRFLRRSGVIVSLFAISTIILLLLFIFGDFVKGAQNRFDLGIFSLQPSDPIKLVVILLLAKYFSRRHVEIAHIRHILVSGFYTFVLFFLVFLQPDFGSAIIIALIWLGMVLVSGISKKHFLIVFFVGAVAFAGLWGYVFEDYQKERIQTFIHPLTDIQGAGYNAYQSTIAVGSGQVLGKGIGYGTQSKLQFLPEYETDFIFAAFAEEWGFVGVIIVLLLYGVVIWRIILNAMYGATNFEILFGVGLAILFMSQFIVHVGMNIGLLPVTGTTVPFLSYGGSHLITEFVGLGILMGMRRYRRAAHKDDIKKEFLGV